MRAAGFAALFIIVVAGIFFISGGYFDVGADKNPKEQIVKDDMVVSKDGGYGDDGGEDELVITEWDEIDNYYKEYLIGLLRPRYYYLKDTYLSSWLYNRGRKVFNIDINLKIQIVIWKYMNF